MNGLCFVFVHYVNPPHCLCEGIESVGKAFLWCVMFFKWFFNSTCRVCRWCMLAFCEFVAVRRFVWFFLWLLSLCKYKSKLDGNGWSNRVTSTSGLTQRFFLWLLAWPRVAHNVCPTMMSTVWLQFTASCEGRRLHLSVEHDVSYKQVSAAAAARQCSLWHREWRQRFICTWHRAGHSAGRCDYRAVQLYTHASGLRVRVSWRSRGKWKVIAEFWTLSVIRCPMAHIAMRWASWSTIAPRPRIYRMPTIFRGTLDPRVVRVSRIANCHRNLSHRWLAELLTYCFRLSSRLDFEVFPVLGKFVLMFVLRIS